MGVISAATPLPGAAGDSPVPADELESLHRRRTDLGQGVQAVQQERQAVLGQLFALGRRQEELRLQVAELAAQEQQAAQSLAAVEAESRALRARYDERLRLFGIRLRFLYERGVTGYAEALLTATDWSDFLERVAYLEFIIEHDARLMAEVRELRGRVAAAEAQVRAERDRLAGLRAQAEARAAELAAAVAEREAHLAALADQRAEMEAALAELEQVWVAQVQPVLANFGQAFHRLALEIAALSPDAVEMALDPLTVRVTVAEVSLNQFIARLPAFQDLAFDLRPDRAVLRGQFADLPLEIDGRFTIDGRKLLRYAPDSVRFFDVPIPAATTERLVESGWLEIDLSALIPDPARLLDLVVEEGRLILTGGIRPGPGG